MMPSGRKRKIAVFGSAANPPTLAHRAFAEVLTSCGKYDLVIFLPSGVRRDKPHLTLASHRVRMSELTFHDEWKSNQPTEFRLDLREAHGDSIPTADLLRELDLEYEGEEIIFATGVDVLTPKSEYGGKCDVAHYWEEGEDMMRERTFAVLPRAGYPDPAHLIVEGALPAHFHVLPGVEEESSGISSTEIRARVASGQPVSGYVDESVVAYMFEHGLYQ